MPPRKTSENTQSRLRGLAVYTGIGMSLAFELGGAMALGAWLGVLLDRQLHSKPWGMIAGIVLFLTLAFVHIFRTLERLQNKTDQEDAHEGGAPQKRERPEL